MANANEYSHRNGETTPPELAPDEFSHYWFDGIAHYDNWEGRGQLVVITGGGTDRVIGLVVVAKVIDLKHPVATSNGYVRTRSAMIPEPEHGGYDLDRCEGRWWGPVSLPPLSGDMLPSTAAVEDYELFKRFRQ